MKKTIMFPTFQQILPSYCQTITIYHRKNRYSNLLKIFLDFKIKWFSIITIPNKQSKHMNYDSRYLCLAVPCILHIICKLQIIFLGKVKASWVKDGILYIIHAMLTEQTSNRSRVVSRSRVWRQCKEIKKYIIYMKYIYYFLFQNIVF